MTTYTPRVISLTKREGQSFGFLLRLELVEEGHLIRNLDRGGLAELAGLKDGDRILRVNGIFVDDLDHSLVAGMVRNSGSSVILHVLDKHSYKQSKASGANLSEPQSRPTMNGTARTDPKPKLCFLEKAKSGYGFSLKSKHGEEGIFIFDVTPSGVAEKAGAKTSDRVLEVNSENVEIATHDQIVEKIKAGGNSIMFLLADEETERHYKNKKIKLGVGLATTKYLPHTPRIVDITKGSDGYGYFLRSYPKLKGHFIKDIDKGSPAEKVGLRDMDRLVAINGDGLDGLTHEQVVERIHQCGDKCCLLVVDAETDNMYKLGGASPLLYWEEMRGPLPQPSPPASPKATAKPIAALPAYDQAPAPAKPSEDNYKPKLCKLEKTSSGFGFHLNGIVGETGQYFMKEVVKGGVADRAGLEDEDIVIEVDGVNVEAHPYGEVVDMIKASGNSLVLLVVDQQAYNYFKAKKIPITTLLLSQDSFDRPHTPASLKEVKEVEEEDKEESDKEEGDKEESNKDESDKDESDKEEGDKEESDKEESDRDKGDKEEESNKEIEKNKEEESNKEEKRDKEGEKEPATLPILTEARERTASASSSSSSLSVDEQL